MRTIGRRDKLGNKRESQSRGENVASRERKEEDVWVGGWFERRIMQRVILCVDRRPMRARPTRAPTNFHPVPMDGRRWRYTRIRLWESQEENRKGRINRLSRVDTVSSRERDGCGRKIDTHTHKKKGLLDVLCNASLMLRGGRWRRRILNYSKPRCNDDEGKKEKKEKSEKLFWHDTKARQKSLCGGFTFSFCTYRGCISPVYMNDAASSFYPHP